MRRFRCPRVMLSANIAVALLLPVALGGCGPDGPRRFQISGTVRQGDTPIPAGHIVFEPNASLGNAGPQGVAEIQAGRYRTLPQRGCVTGPLLATVHGNSGEPHAENPRGLPLFPPYRVELTVEDRATNYDIVIPAEHSF